MELEFVSPRLSELDELDSEILACSVWEDQRPCDGIAGLCDWRLAGRISSMLRDGFLRGERGEVLMVPGRPRMPFDKVLLFGAGPRNGFDEQAFRGVLGHMLETIVGLRSRLAVVQLPGRQNGLIAADRAADMLLEVTSRDPDTYRSDVWTLVEDLEARRSIQQHMIEERRRIRR